MDFRMELHAEVLPLHVAYRCERTVAAPRQHCETLRHMRDPVAMRHPYFGDHIEHGAAHRWLDLSGAIFALRRGIHLPAQRVCQCLHSITDSKDWQTCFEDKVLNVGRALFINRSWPTR